jgi:hypothetical protein
MIRSALAVLAGIVVLTVTSFAIEGLTDPLMTRMFPDVASGGSAWTQNLPKLFMLLYSMVCVMAGGYVTAWLAPRSGVRHAAIMGAIQMALTLSAMVEFRDRAPLWWWLAGLVLTVPAAWSGGRIRAKWRRGGFGLRV